MSRPAPSTPTSATPFRYDAVVSGVPIPDDRGQAVSAHGANIVKDGDTLSVTVLRENWYWVNKKQVRSGSQGYVVALDKLSVRE